MKRGIKTILIIEVQIIIILFLFVIFKVNKLEGKIFNTNKFVHEVLTNKRLENLRTINNDDIIIGDENAPVTIILYSRFDCSACNEFFIENYKKIKSEFIETGVAKIVVRYLVHSSKPNALYATKCAYYANKMGFYNLYISSLSQQYPSLDSLLIKNTVLNIGGIEEELDSFNYDKKEERKLLYNAAKAREAGIRSTPTIFINKQRLIGNRRYEKIIETILSEFESVSCE